MHSTILTKNLLELTTKYAVLCIVWFGEKENGTVAHEFDDEDDDTLCDTYHITVKPSVTFCVSSESFY